MEQKTRREKPSRVGFWYLFDRQRRLIEKEVEEGLASAKIIAEKYSEREKEKKRRENSRKEK